MNFFKNGMKKVYETLTNGDIKKKKKIRPITYYYTL